MTTQPSDSTDTELPLVEHLQALRTTLIHCLIVVFVLMLAALAFADPIYAWITKPLGSLLSENHLKLVIISPLEQAITYLKLSFYCGLAGSVPFLLREIWLFIAPALKNNEKKFLLPVIFIGTALFASGLAVCYFLVLPFAMQTILTWVPAGIEATLSMERYMLTVLQLMLAFGLAFETPLIIAMLIISGLVPAEKISKIRKFYIVAAFILAAMLTPPDPLSQVLMAIPLLLFFELGLILGRLLKNES